MVKKIKNAVNCLIAAIILTLMIAGVVACGLESDNQARKKQEKETTTTVIETETAELLPRETILVK